MAVHLVFYWPISCIGPHISLSIIFYWPISCIGPHISLSIIPHAWEIFLEMLTVDSHWEFHTVQLLKHVRVAP
jgi:hypothetical protein